MGHIREILAKAEIPRPDGWKPKKESFCLPFGVELKEDIHIHWQDIRIEMEAFTFKSLAYALSRACDRWKADGSPETSMETKRYGTWLFEEEYDFVKDRNIELTKDGYTRHHFRVFPHTESGQVHYDSIFQIEIQKNNWVHIHYKNFRLELGMKTFLTMAKAIALAAYKCEKNAIAWKLQRFFERGRISCLKILINSPLGKLKRLLVK